MTAPKKKSGQIRSAKLPNRPQNKPGTGKKPAAPVAKKGAGKKKPVAIIATTPAKKRGAPSSYDPDLHPYMAWDLAIRGKTNEEIAVALSISRPTLLAWGKAHPEFLSILKAGKDLSDAKVTNSLFQLAFGYEYEEVKTEKDDFGNTKTTRIIKHVPGNPTACIFWLKNRRPKEWRDKQDIEHSGTVSWVDLMKSCLQKE